MSLHKFFLIALDFRYICVYEKDMEHSVGAHRAKNLH